MHCSVYVSIALLISWVEYQYAWIDNDTVEKTIIRRKDGKSLELVMSDEFRTPNRSFLPGDDNIFEAVEKPDNTNESIQFCKLIS